MKLCLYCGLEKPNKEFSDEHIWPKALGGDYLPHDVWRTHDVCQGCNSISGLFVDGSFIRSWFGQAELSSGSLEYLAGNGKPSAIPLHYLGPIQNVPVPAGYIADYWVGPCGAIIIHIRPEDDDKQWITYASGNPKVKKLKASRAYMALTSGDEFWSLTSLLSFKRHFDQADRFIVNADFPSEWAFNKPDRSHPVQAEDMKTVDAIIDQSRAGKNVHSQIAVPVDLGNRLLAKLGLAVGYKILGAAFLETDYAVQLRRWMREANAEKRKDISVRCSGIFGGLGLGGAEKILEWAGGWVLMLSLLESSLSLCVVSPSVFLMSVLISDNPTLLDALDPKYKDGIVWITVPIAKEAVGPISLADYLAHQTTDFTLPELVSLAGKRGDPMNLPPIAQRRMVPDERVT